MTRTNLIILYANSKDAYILFRNENEQQILAIGYDLSNNDDFNQLEHVGSLAGASNFLLECHKQRSSSKEREFRKYGISYNLSNANDVQLLKNIMQQVVVKRNGHQKKANILYNTEKMQEMDLVAV